MASIPAFVEGIVPDARSAPDDAPAREWRLPLRTSLAWACAVAFVMSTQYLVQPFVWSYWSIEDVLLGWADVSRDRAVMAVTIALALVGVTRLPVRVPGVRAGLIGLAAVLGAIVGEAFALAIGETGAHADAWSMAGRVAQWTVLGLCTAAMYRMWSRNRSALAAARAADLAASRNRSLLVETQLQALRHQLDPHFLFNTLATIRRFRGTGERDGADLLRHLNDYLRSTMPLSRHMTTLGEEIDLVASYLAIVEIRMTGRLAVTWDVDPSLRTCPCPPLTLATLVENAVKHGITPTAAGGTITVRARREGGALRIVVADTGVGIRADEHGTGGVGIGLANVRARLRTLHGSDASLVLRANVPRGVRAEVRLPLDREAYP